MNFVSYGDSSIDGAEEKQELMPVALFWCGVIEKLPLKLGLKKLDDFLTTTLPVHRIFFSLIKETNGLKCTVMDYVFALWDIVYFLYECF